MLADHYYNNDFDLLVLLLSVRVLYLAAGGKPCLRTVACDSTPPTTVVRHANFLQALSFLKAQGVSHPYLQASHVGITQHGHPVLQNMVGALSCRIASKGDGTASLTAPVQDIVAAAAAAVGSEIPTSAAELPHFPALCMLSPEALAVVLSAQGAPLSTEQADLSSQASFLAGQLLYRIITGRPPLAEYPWRYVRSEGGSTSITYEAAWMAPLPAHVPPALAQTVTALLAPLPSQRLPIEVAVRSFAQMGAAGIGVPPPCPWWPVSCC